MNETQCPICSSQDLLEINKLDNEITRYFCKGCTVAFVTPMTKREQREALYNKGYYTTGIMEGYHNADLRPYFHMMRRHLPKSIAGLKMLDIGCATGQYLKYSNEMGMCSEGIDISHYSISVCQERGLTAYCGTLQELSLPKAKYDWIIARDIIEHVTDPLGLLEGISDHLVPGGIASIFSCDINSLREPEVVQVQNPDEHPFLFDFALLARLINFHLDIQVVERFKFFDENPHGYRVLITARKPLSGKRPLPWIPEEPQQKHFGFEQYNFRANLKLFFKNLDSLLPLHWLLWRTSALWQIENFLDLLGKYRQSDTIDLVSQESTLSFFSRIEIPGQLISVPDGRLTIEGLSISLKGELKDTYDIIVAFTRGEDASGYENIIDILEFFQEANRIIFNITGCQVRKKFAPKKNL